MKVTKIIKSGRMSIICPSRSGKTNVLLNLIQNDDSLNLIMTVLLTRFISMLKT